MKMTQLNLDGTPELVQPSLRPEDTENRGQHLNGRPPGAKGIVSEHRKMEAARMAVLGESLPVIAEQLGVGRTRAGQIVREAEEDGLVDDMSSERSARVREMSERRYQAAGAAMDIVQARLDNIQTDIIAQKKGAMDARAMNDAFRALDRTEYTVDGEAKMRDSGKSQNINIDKLALFSPEAIQAAQADSNRVYGDT